MGTTIITQWYRYTHLQLLTSWVIRADGNAWHFNCTAVSLRYYVVQSEVAVVGINLQVLAGLTKANGRPATKVTPSM